MGDSAWASCEDTRWLTDISCDGARRSTDEREGRLTDLARAREGRRIDRLRCHGQRGMEAALMVETTW